MSYKPTSPSTEKNPNNFYRTPIKLKKIDLIYNNLNSKQTPSTEDPKNFSNRNQEIKFEKTPKDEIDQVSFNKKYFNSPCSNFLFHSPKSFLNYLNSYSRDNINVLNLLKNKKNSTSENKENENHKNYLVKTPNKLTFSENDNKTKHLKEISSFTVDYSEIFNPKPLNSNKEIKCECKIIINESEFSSEKKSIKQNISKNIFLEEKYTSNKNNIFESVNNINKKTPNKNLINDLINSSKQIFFMNSNSEDINYPKKKYNNQDIIKSRVESKDKSDKKQIKAFNNINLHTPTTIKNKSFLNFNLGKNEDSYKTENCPLFSSSSEKKRIFECKEENVSTFNTTQKKNKRFRKSTHQIDYLFEIYYNNNKLLSKEIISEVSLKLDLAENKVYKWLWDQKNKEIMEKKNNCIFEVKNEINSKKN